MEAKPINGIAYAQSECQGHEADRALDGKPETYWKAEPYYQWWMMDCQSLYHINTITVETKCEDDTFYRYAIEYSSDRINWQELYEKIDDALPMPCGETYEAADMAGKTPQLTKERVRAMDCDAFVGFMKCETGELEPGWTE